MTSPITEPRALGDGEEWGGGGGGGGGQITNQCPELITTTQCK